MNEAVTPAIVVTSDDEAGDEELMMAFASGDADAFDALYARYRGPVYRFFLRQLSHEDAEEAHQDTWLRLIGARDRYTPRGSFRSFLFTVAHNVITDRYRRAARRPQGADGEDPAQLADGGSDTPMQLHREQLAERLYAAIRRLPSAQREALVMREETGMSHAEIAAATSATAEGVKSRIRYAMARLRRELARYAEDDH